MFDDINNGLTADQHAELILYQASLSQHTEEVIQMFTEMLKNEDGMDTDACKTWWAVTLSAAMQRDQLSSLAVELLYREAERRIATE